MKAVLYRPRPDAPASGAILQCMEGAEENIAATAAQLGCVALAVDVLTSDLDATAAVVDGQVVALVA